MQFYQSVIVNQSVALECDATGLPRPVVTWYKDDVRLSNERAGRLRLVDGGARLNIESADLIDTGSYECRAENDAGRDRLHYHLTVLSM